MSTSDWLSFRKVRHELHGNEPRPWRFRFAHGAGDIYRNALGYEIRGVNPYWAISLGKTAWPIHSLGNKQRPNTQWEVHLPSGDMVGFGPRFRDAMDIFSAHICGATHDQ